MALIEPDSKNTGGNLTPEDYTSKGEINSLSGDLNLVVGSASRSESYIASKQWGLLWRDSDLLFQSPRPLSTFENTYIL